MSVSEIEKRGLFLLSEKWNGTQAIYRGILEIVSRFGFVSIEEVMYRFDLMDQQAKDRLKYLMRVGLLRKFESFTKPRTFFCLSLLGRQMAEAHGVSDEIVPFGPTQYNALNQRHDRMLARIYSALRKTFREDFKGWMGERTLRQNENLLASPMDPAGRRVMDGLFLLRIQKEKFTGLNQTDNSESVASELWWCGLELELSLKSAERYRKQFKGLSATVFNSFESRQIVPLVLFLCGSDAIAQALNKYWLEERDNFGKCLFLFGMADRFLGDLGEAPFVRRIGSDERNILARDMNRVRVRVASPRVAAS